jgi:GNAT superfamily N-acetyltransferase
MSGFEIRAVIREEWSELLALMRGFDAAGTLGFPITEKTLWKHTFGDSDYQPECLLGAYADGVLVACGMGIIRPWRSLDRGFIKFIHGAAARSLLLSELEQMLRRRGVKELVYGSSSPSYLSPGVPAADAVTQAMLLAAGWKKSSERLSLSVAVERVELPACSTVVTEVGAAERAATLHFIEQNFSVSWAKESLPALHGEEQAFCVIVQQACGEIIGFAAMHATNPNWFGPMGVKTKERGKGLGYALLHHVFTRLHREQTEQVILPWINDKIDFYEKVLGKPACNPIFFKKFSKLLRSQPI